MLSQQTQALQPTQELELLQLQEREMELLRNNYNNILVIATLVLTFAIAGSIDYEQPGTLVRGQDPYWTADVGIVPHLLFFYHGFQALSLGCELYSCAIATAVSVWGPDMAINGARGDSTMLEVACIIVRAIGGMRMARVHIYGSCAAGVVFIVLATLLGAMSRIGWVRRGALSARWHRAGATVVGSIFAVALVIMICAFFRIRKIFSTDRLMDARLALPGVPCVVCGDVSRHGMLEDDQRILPCSFVGSGASFKCYQCVGRRAESTASGADRGCCADPERPGQPRPQAQQQRAWFVDDWDMVDEARTTSVRGGPPRPAGPEAFHPAHLSEWDVVPSGSASVSGSWAQRTKERPPNRSRNQAATPDFQTHEQFHPGSQRKH
eukprot:TRINITY_DN848_c0_g2_i1.p1 TRINITY_DN848_c0_g2~~TRINITY_DN848_c0_g2_i1.p1  ORF type:complete len:406 (+),score=142.71 TRINITY_DN848_c0_g2_i1:77-1219(+)